MKRSRIFRSTPDSRKTVASPGKHAGSVERSVEPIATESATVVEELRAAGVLLLGFVLVVEGEWLERVSFLHPFVFIVAKASEVARNNVTATRTDCSEYIDLIVDSAVDCLAQSFEQPIRYTSTVAWLLSGTLVFAPALAPCK